LLRVVTTPRKEGARRESASVDSRGGSPHHSASSDPVELTERLMAMIEDLEMGRQAMSWANVDELVGRPA
jgi:hypothetical protein